MIGGYQIVDFKGKELSATPVTIPGIYESIEGNYHKPLLMSGLNIEGIERAGVFLQPTTDSGNYIISVYGGTIAITSDDAVTYNAVARIDMQDVYLEIQPDEKETEVK